MLICNTPGPRRRTPACSSCCRGCAVWAWTTMVMWWVQAASTQSRSRRQPARKAGPAAGPGCRSGRAGSRPLYTHTNTHLASPGPRAGTRRGAGAALPRPVGRCTADPQRRRPPNRGHGGRGHQRQRRHPRFQDTRQGRATGHAALPTWCNPGATLVQPYTPPAPPPAECPPALGHPRPAPTAAPPPSPPLPRG